MAVEGRDGNDPDWRVQLSEDKQERIVELREIIAWLDALPKGALTAVIDEQRQRAIGELAVPKASA
jgi:hypothetical protein